ncbi:MAG: hypothetical protein ACTSRG_25180 [Candidatus Helarchaeota archaeon]
MAKIFSEQLERLNDLCKLIYECTNHSGEISCIKTHKLSHNQFFYFRLFMISEFFEHQGAAIINYVITDLEPKEFLFWNLIKNEIELTDTGRVISPNIVPFLIAKVKKMPAFMLGLLETLKNDKRG